MKQTALSAPTPTAPAGPELRDIHLPPEPAWWPPAPGWWLLAVLVLLGLLLALGWWRRQHRARRQRQQVLTLLDQLATRHEQDGDSVALASGLQEVLRRVARRHVPQATQQRGAAWQETLARMPVDAETLEQLLALDQRIYQPATPFDHAGAIAAARQWLGLALKPSRWKRAAEQDDA